LIATTPSPIPAVPAPEWTSTDKEAGRVDALMPDATGRCFVGGNFTQPKRYMFVARADGTVGTLDSRGVAGRVYDLAWDATNHRLHVAGAGGYTFHENNVWTGQSGHYRSVGLLPGFPENVFLGSENGQVELVGGWKSATAGSARDLVVTSDSVYVAGAVSNSRGLISKINVETGKLDWQLMTVPALDLAISPDGATIYAAFGGPGGTVSAYDAVSGQRKWFHMTDGNCQAICTLADGTVVAGMHGDYVASLVNKTIRESGTGGRVPRKKVFALDPNGNLLDWHVNLTSTASPLGVWALASSPSMLYVGGDFTHVNGVEHPRLTCFAVT